MDLKNLAKVDLIKELGLEDLPEEQQEKMLMDMGEIIQQRIILRVAEGLSDEDKENFVKILEEKKEQPEEIEKFIREKVPEIDDIIMEEVGRYKQEITSLIEGVKNKAVEEEKTSGDEEKNIEA